MFKQLSLPNLKQIVAGFILALLGYSAIMIVAHGTVLLAKMFKMI